ncbi:hypothetical protein [Nguyenibacter sp. L1]|uniref:hypothetical protein n=1 Tax=Nguyenibacter sp. L1 TaxID=3049350 RepID=UPI002B487AD0|nr:hypothetical protein [Nguyenibacter sp. L1]WRH88452.1 hypothetical protein QN315_02110 [Nguyenibacter sp. L1]
MVATLRTALYSRLAASALAAAALLATPALVTPALVTPALAAPDQPGTSGTTGAQSTAQGIESPGGEHLTVKGRHSLPPGYQDAPSMDLTHGPDPDHDANVHRDAVTGSDLSRFGSAYQGSGPYGQGQLGDSTGNGWVTPR